MRKKKQKKNSNSNGSKNCNGNKESGKDRSTLHQGLVDGTNSGFNSASCVDFQDVWCGPGIGFSADAAASVDCVVARRNVTGRGKIDGDKMSGHRDRDREVNKLILYDYIYMHFAYFWSLFIYIYIYMYLLSLKSFEFMCFRFENLFLLF